MWLGAIYRQKAIQLGAYDRAIKTFQGLAARRDAGPNVYISLALAYVDKVPTVSSFKRIFVGNDASAAINKSIDRRPSLVAYYIRGLISLFYPEGLFHRGRQGVADLQRAREIASAEPEQSYHARVYLSLGDGYWRIKIRAQARAIWEEGSKRFPEDAALQARLSAVGRDLDGMVSRASTRGHGSTPASASSSLIVLTGPEGSGVLSSPAPHVFGRKLRTGLVTASHHKDP